MLRSSETARTHAREKVRIPRVAKRSDPETPLGPSDYLHFEASRCLRRTQGRETFLSGPIAGAPDGCVVKRALERAPARFLAWGRLGLGAKSAGQREYDNLVALAASGLPVPRAVTWAEEDTGAGRRSAVVMERIVHRETVRDRLARVAAGERRELARALCAIVVRLHAQGFVHRDLYLQHVLVRADDGALVLIDAGRVRRWKAPRARWFVKDLAALLHSTPDRVSARERLRFLSTWLDARGITGRAVRRRWLRAVVAKRARMAAHVPRDERALESAR